MDNQAVAFTIMNGEATERSVTWGEFKAMTIEALALMLVTVARDGRELVIAPDFK